MYGNAANACEAERQTWREEIVANLQQTAQVAPEKKEIMVNLGNSQVKELLTQQAEDRVNQHFCFNHHAPEDLNLEC